MRNAGEFCLLAAFVGSGFAAFAGLAGGTRRSRWLRLAGSSAALLSVTALSLVMGILGRALYTKDFSFEYVAQYSSQTLPWHYSVSALWVGQAGSLLLWAWLLGLVAIGFRFWPRRSPPTESLHEPAFGLLMGYLCFLIAIMVFAADPMAASLSPPAEGAGLSPLLQHPAMLIHPPVVFLGYSLWTVPFALAVAALLGPRVDARWVVQARPWALMAWSVLGSGILLGSYWAYEELSWGGYWGWDPVENGSLIPWLTGTALIHALMAWQHRRVLKKTALTLAIATFGLCNFATFLTRSGIFSSLHAFSQSPIGWLFLALMILLAAGGIGLLVRRRGELSAEKPLGSVFSREALIVLAAVALVLLTVVVIAGTLSSALSSALSGQTIFVGAAFYNNVLIPTGLVLLMTAALAPLMRWGEAPLPNQRRWLWTAAGAGVGAAVLAAAGGQRQPLTMAVIGLSVMALVALGGALWLDARRVGEGGAASRLLVALGRGRRQYAGFLIHIGFFSLALGVTGSSLGKHHEEFDLREGQTVHWAGRQVRLVRRGQRELPDKLIAEAELEVVTGGRSVTLVPARYFFRLDRSWTTKVAIDSTWHSDFYVVLQGGDMEGMVHFSFVESPMMRWMWLSGWITVAGTLWRLWPTRRRRVAVAASKPAPRQASPAPQRRAAA
jgi:cytochrome c-type biogenesis protein CcmF